MGFMAASNEDLCGYATNDYFGASVDFSKFTLVVHHCHDRLISASNPITLAQFQVWCIGATARLHPSYPVLTLPEHEH
jgi:hypothetical protein